MARDDLSELLGVPQPTPYAQIVANDPYTGFGNIFKQTGDIATKANDYPTKDRLIAGLLSGLIQGGFEGASQDYQTRATDAYKDVVLQSVLGQPVERPGVLAPNVFTTAQENASIFRNKLLEEQADRSMIGDEEAQILKKINPDYEKIRDPRVLDRVLRAQQLSDIQGRSEKKYERELETRQIPGLKIKSNQIPTDKDYNSAIEIKDIGDLIVSNIQDLKTSLKTKGQSLTGAAYIEQARALGDLLFLAKERFGGGAAYTQLEEAIANVALPKILSNPRASLYDVLKTEVFNRDPILALDELAKGIARETKIKLGNRKYDLEDSSEEIPTSPKGPPSPTDFSSGPDYVRAYKEWEASQ